MFNKTINNYTTKVDVKGVNAPEAARFLHDIENESARRINKVIFDHIDTPEIKMEWAVAHEVSHVDNCHRILIYYKQDGERTIKLDVIEKDVGPLMGRNKALEEIAKDMSSRITQRLVMILTK